MMQPNLRQNPRHFFMPNRPDALETLHLALELLRRIPRQRKITATELHLQLQEAGIDRDLRTIQRQLEMLCQHFDIERDDRSKPYGYRWLSQSKGFSVPMLTEQESLLLMLAEQHLRNLLPASVMKSMSGFFEQARTNLGPYANARLEREWIDKVRVVPTTQTMLPPKIRPDVFEAVTHSLYRNLWLEVDYGNAAGKRSTYDVMPLGLAQQGARLLLVCHFRGFDDERTLSLHRMHAARVSTLDFDRPKRFSMNSFEADGGFSFGRGQRIQLKFCVEKEAGFHILETPLSADQTVVERDDHYEISATVIDSDVLDWWLRGFGENIKNVTKTTRD